MVLRRLLRGGGAGGGGGVGGVVLEGVVGSEYREARAVLYSMLTAL